MKISIDINGKRHDVVAPAKTVHAIIALVKNANPGKTNVIMTSAYMKHQMERTISSKDREKLERLIGGAA